MINLCGRSGSSLLQSLDPKAEHHLDVPLEHLLPFLTITYAFQ